MKLCDWTTLFGALFFCGLVLMKLQSHAFQQAQFTTEEYNRNIDRATMDCLMDVVKEEKKDGSILIDGKSAEKHFYEQLFFVFDATSEKEKYALQSGVKMMKLLNQKNELSMKEADWIRSQMEEEANRKYEQDIKLFSFYFPYVRQEEWYEPLEKRGLYVFYDVLDWQKNSYNRFLFSGSKIKKNSR